MPVITWKSGDNAHSWTDVTEPTEEELLFLSNEFGLHPYTLRDCLEPEHLPKSEELGGILFFITRILIESKEKQFRTFQKLSTKLAVFYNQDFIITVHRLPHPFLEQIKTSCLDNGKCSNTGEIVTRILWHVLHTYDQPAINLCEEVDIYENRIFRQRITPAMMQELHFIKQKASVCRRLLMLTGDVINALRNNGSDSVLLQDVRDLHVRLITLYEQAHEDVTNLLNIYLSISAQKTNQVMKILTLFSVFFMPLTFIVGIYGMNFEYMPELKTRWGYPAVMILMAGITLVIYLWFRKRKWM